MYCCLKCVFGLVAYQLLLKLKWIYAPAEEVPKLWLSGSFWGEKMGEKSFKLALLAFPLNLYCLSLLEIGSWAASDSMVVFLGVGSMLGKSLEQTEIKRELETRLVWTVTKSTNGTHGVSCEICWWPLSLLDKRNQIPCLFYKMDLIDSFPFLPLVCPAQNLNVGALFIIALNALPGA